MTEDTRRDDRPWDRDRILQVSAANLMHAYARYYAGNPLVVTNAEMQFVWDEQGNRLLDAFSGVVTVSVGHRHPEVEQAISDVTAGPDGRGLRHVTTLFYTEQLARTAEALARVMPKGIGRFFATNSGTEASEMAGHTAWLKAGRQGGLVSLLHSFHGRTAMSASLTGQGVWRNGPMLPGVWHIPNPYTYRRPAGVGEQEFLEMCLFFTEEIFRHSCAGRVAAVFIEPMQGNGGVISAGPWYYNRLATMARKYGAAVISDEVQTGFGRTGRMWGCDWWEGPDAAVPDGITMAKGMGNGVPVGGFMTTEEMSRAYDGLSHFSTYGGNPPAMAAVAKVVEIIDRTETKLNISRQGHALKAGLGMLAQSHPSIGEVRGEGLMLGVELVTNRDFKTPMPADKMAQVLQVCRDNGVLVGKGGVYGNVVRIKPPYCITDDDTASILVAMSRALTAVEAA